MALNFRFLPICDYLRQFAETLRWRLCGLSVDADQAERGRFGEWSARRFLLRKGFYVIDRNWRNPNDRRDEIDLICKDREVLAFVEVRARNASARTTGYESISPRKKKSLLKSFKAYLNRRKERPEHFRFDVVEIDLPADGTGKLEIFHHENVALFPPRFH